MASLALSDLFLGVSRIPEPQNRSKNPTHRSLLLPFGKPWGWGELKVDGEIQSGLCWKCLGWITYSSDFQAGRYNERNTICQYTVNLCVYITYVLYAYIFQRTVKAACFFRISQKTATNRRNKKTSTTRFFGKAEGTSEEQFQALFRLSQVPCL